MAFEFWRIAPALSQNPRELGAVARINQSTGDSGILFRTAFAGYIPAGKEQLYVEKRCRPLAVRLPIYALTEPFHLLSAVYSFLHYAEGSSLWSQYWRHYYLLSLGFLDFAALPAQLAGRGDKLVQRLDGKDDSARPAMRILHFVDGPLCNFPRVPIKEAASLRFELWNLLVILLFNDS